jgi:hypothetical protein
LPTNIPDRENESQEGTNRARCRYTLKSKFNVRVHIHQEERVICRMVQFLFGQRLFAFRVSSSGMRFASQTNTQMRSGCNKALL